MLRRSKGVREINTFSPLLQDNLSQKILPQMRKSEIVESAAFKKSRG